MSLLLARAIPAILSSGGVASSKHVHALTIFSTFFLLPEPTASDVCVGHGLPSSAHNGWKSETSMRYSQLYVRF